MREKLDYHQQIAYLKSKGVKFEIVDEKKALEFLKRNTYLFKLKAYAANYAKDAKGLYINLDFAYLQELSTLNMYIRQMILKLSLNCEHCLKSMLVHDITVNPKVDGKEIVQSFFDEYYNIEKKVDIISDNAFNRNMIEKYRDQLAVWDLMEILSFGDFITLYSDYYYKYPSAKSLIDYVDSVKILRDACAHNNCLINNLNVPLIKHEVKNKLKQFLDQKTDFNHHFTRNLLSNNFIYHLVTFLYVFDSIVESDAVKYYNFKELHQLMKNRIVYHQQYFKDNQVLIDSYHFIDAVIEVYYQKHLAIHEKSKEM